MNLSQDALFSKLSDSPCSDAEYARATQVWISFECESMADYHDIYLKCDVLLLADFFEKFRAICLAHYSLDDAHKPANYKHIHNALYVKVNARKATPPRFHVVDKVLIVRKKGTFEKGFTPNWG